MFLGQAAAGLALFMGQAAVAALTGQLEQMRYLSPVLVVEALVVTGDSQ
jgi:hypothetical protein